MTFVDHKDSRKQLSLWANNTNQICIEMRPDAENPFRTLQIILSTSDAQKLRDQLEIEIAIAKG